MGPRSTSDQAVSFDVGGWYKQHRDGSIFKHLTHEQSVRLLRGARPVELPAGETVKADGARIYLVAEGELALFTRGARRIRQGGSAPGR